MNNKYMQIAINLARKGEPKVFPNPQVGCVVVKDDKIVGRGWHKYFGGKHAEINAIECAGKNAKGADLYVTLEPCNSYGKCPPCALAIVNAKIKRVFYAVKDKKNFGTKEFLEKNGIEVHEGLFKKKSTILIKDYLRHLKVKPLVSIKAAMTLDGKIATRCYDSKWITSQKARNLVYKMRTLYDAVLVGKNTALKDNPLLTSHNKNLKNPIRVVIDPKLELPKSYKLFNNRANTIIFYDKNISKIPKHFKKEGVILTPINIEASKRNFNLIIERLNSFSIKRILIEGGSEIIASALFSKSVDDIYFFIAPKIIGGKTSIPVVGGQGVKKISESLNIKKMQVKKIGIDFFIKGKIGESKG
ncbi:MAG: bifunctional diaminohydroxyphosphoribosylaminopyrimidine deaminase/5-amino-6-(5-phosphoribosylamino)uracil reductase RibD [Endomicrobium sp.]|jgi:diaminohydroxyphosphoribosylaminopyrimidine deaminase/5-amino-6-(5-phosphoribosylamino)uracil reductase|uniref:bifunctional diaminohydroxyphosphoribosylaminopyrimidine deaminase/5-amino-6-(5-phosphoribosylamino)uracil reductase RibD n=1 Tax=Candidatus Endomicrobiellum cubanum TaxID=3242325 RepID=UPI0028393993|nr:bifunctional diaminohydroxyphosphoribosylaminopyrimidine deaminase/5-amino-6-(5-phosphoribosylamino)uracil reductase RibD [Endomicrobium sp.]